MFVSGLFVSMSNSRRVYIERSCARSGGALSLEAKTCPQDGMDAYELSLGLGPWYSLDWTLREVIKE